MTYVLFVVVIGLRHRHGIFGQEGSGARRAQLEQLRGVGRDQGPEGQRSALEDLSVKAVRDLAQAAGLRVRKDGTATWLRGDELREALLEHLAPQGSAAPQEFAAFVLCFVFFVFFLKKHGYIEGVLRVVVRQGHLLHCRYKFSHTTWVRLFSRATG